MKRAYQTPRPEAAAARRSHASARTRGGCRGAAAGRAGRRSAAPAPGIAELLPAAVAPAEERSELSPNEPAVASEPHTAGGQRSDRLAPLRGRLSGKGAPVVHPG